MINLIRTKKLMFRPASGIVLSLCLVFVGSQSWGEETNGGGTPTAGSTSQTVVNCDESTIKSQLNSSLFLLKASASSSRSKGGPAESPLIGAARGDEVTFDLLEVEPESPQELDKLREWQAQLLQCVGEVVRKSGKQPRLLLNGIPLGVGAKVQNIDNWWLAKKIIFELKLVPPASSTDAELLAVSNFWNSVYREAGWTGSVRYKAELQFEGFGTIAQSTEDTLEISGSSKERRAVAGVAGVIIVVLFFWALVSNDIFRDQSPEWIEKSRALACIQKSQIAWAQWLNELSTSSAMTSDAVVERAAYVYQRFRCGMSTTNELDVQLAATGAILSAKSAPQTSYSLSRVQLGAWLMVTIVGGLVIWIFHGQLPTIPPTFLALLGISGGTRILATLVDSSKEHEVGGIHKNFYADLTTGTTGGGVHRYQSLMVNLTLLTTVSFEILRNLAFPEIDDSWLIILTGSAGVYVATKQVGENPSADSSASVPSGVPKPSQITDDGHVG